MSDNPIIPLVFDQPGAQFVFMPAGKKFPPIETKWQNKGHAFQEAAAHRGNVGIMAGNGFIGLDQDDPKGFASLVLPKTTRWETRPGREGLRFKCNDNIPEVLAKYGFKEDLAQIKLFKDGQPIGEIKLGHSYQVIPPSWKEVDGHRVDYKMLDDVSPAEISLDWLLSELLKNGITFRKEPSPTKMKQAAVKKASLDKDKAQRYAEAALRDEVNALARTPEGDRNNQLNKSSFSLGQFVAARVLEEGKVIRALSNAATYIGLDANEVERTIRSGLEAGARCPREIPGSDGVSEEELEAARKKVKDLSELIKSDPGAPYDPEMHAAILLVKEHDSRGWARVRAVLKGAGELRAFDKESRKAEGTKEKNQGALTKITERIPDWIEAHHFKTVKDTDRLYHYAHGVYLDDGDMVLKRLMEEEFGDVTTENVVRDAVGKVKRRTYVDREEFNKEHILNIKNGLLDLDSLELKPHTPDYLSTAQLEVVYYPSADCPAIKKFIKEVAQSQDHELIKEIMGWLLWPEYTIHKAVMLLGPGRNGKGTLLRLITALIGKRNVSNVTLQDIANDKFGKADLFGKMVNIGGDLPSKDLSDTAAFRNLTGGDDNRAQEKYKPAFSFRNKAKLMFSANVLPMSPDDTYAFYSRWILIEFSNTFSIEKGTADPDLDSKLTTPEELSGLLNLALAGLKRLRENGWRFSYSKTVEDVEVMYKRNANPVLAFLMDECEAEADSHIEKTALQQRYNEYAKKHNIRPLSTTSFTKLLKDQSEIPISDFRPWGEHGSEPRAWLGLRFKVKIAQSKLSAGSEEPAKSSLISPPNPGETRIEGDGDSPSIPSRVLATPSLTKKDNLSDWVENKDVSKVGNGKTLDGMDGTGKAVHEENQIKAELRHADEMEKKKEEHFKTPGKREVAGNTDNSHKERAKCPVCGEDIGPDHSNQIFEGTSYCIRCATPLFIVRASVKALGRKTGAGATTSEIYEDVAGRSNRPPKREHMPAMLRAVGAIEKDGRWFWTSAQEETQSQDKGQGTTNNMDEIEHAGTSTDNEGTLLEKLKGQVAQSEAEGKSIVPIVLAQRLECEDKLKWLAKQLRKMGLEQTTDMDPISHMCLWKKK